MSYPIVVTVWQACIVPILVVYLPGIALLVIFAVVVALLPPLLTVLALL